MNDAMQSPLLPAYRAAGASTGEIYGMATGLTLAGAPGGLYLADLSPLPKWLLVGATAATTLRAAGLDVPGLMQTRAGKAGAYVAARAPRQYLVCAGDDGVPPPALTAAPCALRYDSVDFALGGGSGEHGVDDLLAEACTTHLDAYARDAWVPTLVYGVEVALWRVAPHDWRLHAAPADGEFLIETLLDAVRRRHGALLGYRNTLALPQFGAA